MTKPIIAITMGDPASIGPEIAVKLCCKNIYNICKPIIVGDAKVFQQIIDLLQLDAKINIITNVADAKFEFGKPDIFDLNNVDITKLKFGRN